MAILARRMPIQPLAVLLLVSVTLASDEEYRLLRDLRENYDPMERPVANNSEPVNVHLRILLQQIVDVDEKNQILTLVLWMQFMWTDWKMVWSPEEYGGIQSVRFPSDALWKPDILLFNSADEKFDARFPVNFVVQHTGKVLHAPPAIIKSSCDIDITWFPFDEQYGSWTYPGHEVELFIDDKDLEGGNKIDTFYYVHNGEWELIGTPGRKIVSSFEGKSYVELYYFVHIRRKTIYYGMNWIIPSILFLLSNVLGFTMPSECGEKITLQTTNLLSVTVFLGMVADVTPPTSTSVPIIAAFFSISMIILGSSIIFTLLIINVHFRSPRTHKMSPWVRTIFLEWLPWLLLMNRPGRQFKRPKGFKRSITRSGDSSSYSSRRLQQHLQQRREAELAIRKAESLGTPVTARSLGAVASAVFLSQRGAKSVDATSDSGRPQRGLAPTASGMRAAKASRQFAMESSLTAGGSSERQPLIVASANTPASSSQPHDSPPSVQRTKCAQILGGSTSPKATTELEKSATMELLRATLHELSDYLHLSQQKMDEEEEEEEAKADWRFMGLALDRACLFLYSFLSALIPLWIFISIPNPSSQLPVFGDNNASVLLPDGGGVSTA